MLIDFDSLHFLGYIGALAIGIVLGLVGSGGSILAVPIFTYLFQISPITTTSYSLFVVGISSSVGVCKNFKKRLIDYRFAMILAVPSIILTYCSRKFIVPIIPETLISIGNFTLSTNKAILLLFALLMIPAAISMIRIRKETTTDHPIEEASPLVLIGLGALIGVLSGFAGIGGGFIIVPVLVLLVKLPMKRAVATSLFIISLKSLIGFTGDLGIIEFNWTFLVIFTLISFAGIYIGTYISKHVKGENLKRSFGWIVLIIAIGMIYKEVFI